MDNQQIYKEFEEFLKKYRHGISISSVLSAELWDFYKEGYERGYKKATGDLTNTRMVFEQPEQRIFGCIAVKWCDDCKLAFANGPCVCGMITCKKCGKSLKLKKNEHIEYKEVNNMNEKDFEHEWKFTSWYNITPIKFPLSIQ